MQGAKILKLQSNGQYKEMPILLVTVVHNREKGTFHPYTGQSIGPGDYIVDRWAFD